jgi:Domain of unknown function (DUF5123)/Domain of unknown function (DUF4957)/Tissue factor
MKRIVINISVKWLFVTSLLATIFISCQKHYDPNFTLPHQFKPGDITITTEQTKATLTWKASLFSPAATSYTVQVSKDSTFAANIVYDKVVNSTTAVVTDSVLAIRQAYYARVKANSAGTTAESGWVRSNSFSITGEQIFLALTTSDIIDNGVLLKWRTTPGLVRIVITPLPGTPFTVNLTPADLTAEKRIINGLLPNTNYSAEIFDAIKSKGYLTFRTTSALSGNIIDLRGITGRPSVLADTLPLIADASTVVLKRGEIYTIAVALNLNKSVKIISGADLTNPNQAIISLPANFNITAGSTIAFIDFQDVSLIATDYTAKYVFNISNACTITRIGFESCRIENMRGVTRLQTAIINLTNYVVSNCIIDSISNYGVITVDNVNCTAANISIKNSTMYKTERIVISKQNSTSVVIDNCTFNEAPFGNSTASFIVDYNTLNVTGGVTISNSIFGKGKPNAGNILVRDVRVGASTTISSSNNYITADHTVTANPLTPVINYTGTSVTLWVDPYGGNFRFADITFPGRTTTGDPRWRP